MLLLGMVNFMMLLQNRAAQGEQPVPRDQEDVGLPSE
jgi:hypothetical protein